jgi:hypothetical protein
MKCEGCHKRKAFANIYGTKLCKVCIYRLAAIVEEMEKKGGDLNEGEVQEGKRYQEHGAVSGS